MARPPNVVVVITDQQRAPRHWPDEPGWVDALLPADAELRPHRPELHRGDLQLVHVHA